jgi:hypothetical protein
MADLATQDAPFGLNQVTFTPGERLSDRLFEVEEAVLHMRGLEAAEGRYRPQFDARTAINRTMVRR